MTRARTALEDPYETPLLKIVKSVFRVVAIHARQP